MVSSYTMNTTNLKTAYDKLETGVVDPSNYKNEMYDAAFEIISADTFIAGIATTLLDGEKLYSAYKSILDRVYLDGHEWLLEDGSRVVIANDTMLYTYALQIEQLRKECLKFLAGK